MSRRALLTGSLAAVLAAGGLIATGAAASGAAPAATISVTTAAGLKTALSSAAAGDTIALADGTYTGNFTTSRDGTSAKPITLTGSAKAVLKASGGYGLHLDGADYWQVRGLTVTGGQKGIVLDSSNHAVIDGVTVHGLDMEGVHFRKNSADGVIRNSTIYDTGNDNSGMGEGVYVGTAGGSDKSDRVQILDNTIGPGIGAENIDLKEGTTGGLVSGNTFDGDGLTGNNFDDSWVDVKGNDYTIENNTGRHTTDDGYQVHDVKSGWGCGTVFRGNVSDLTGTTGPDQYAIDVTDYDAASCPVTVAGSNTVKGGKGLVNPGVPVGGSDTSPTDPPTSPASTVKVSTAEELTAALAAARPGETIALADGSYTGKFTTGAQGTAAEPITLTGSARAVLHSSEYTGPDAGTDAADEQAAAPAASCPTGGAGYGLWLNGAPYWHLTGFTVDTAAKGIVLDGFQTHTAQAPYGCGNTFADNTFTITDSDGYGIDVTNNSSSKCGGSSPNVVHASNTATGGKGLTNITVTTP